MKSTITLWDVLAKRTRKIPVEKITSYQPTQHGAIVRVQRHGENFRESIWTDSKFDEITKAILTQ
jgi:hypothetical protein